MTIKSAGNTLVGFKNRLSRKGVYLCISYFLPIFFSIFDFVSFESKFVSTSHDKGKCNSAVRFNF